jgi:hypothetical protein
MNILDNHNFLNDLKKLGVNINFEVILSNQYLKFIKNDSDRKSVV